MTSYIQTVLDRHFQNYTFTYGIYKDNPQLLTLRLPQCPKRN